VREFGVATGQAAYPTPLGIFSIVTMQRDPWWIPPPNAEWARGAKPIPPGPGNPLGTRWMGLSAAAVGIHGTPDAASIGYSASHGCIRMRIPDATWLFDHVEVGTPVVIAAA
jgi:lipoprotein-anchoring transpeptidase ErfK/SrfK